MLLLTFVVINVVNIIAESMARKVATLLLLVFGCCSCMEMRETVERTVMVRTTGSDLQPAATGYIYKKESDGPVSLTKMGESEVIEHFTKLYSNPNGHRESIVEESPVYSGKKDEVKSESYSSAPHVSASKDKEEYTKDLHSTTSHDSASQSTSTHASEDVVKPVTELGQEEDKIDGIANEEFDKLFEDYIKQVNFKNNFADYLHGLGHYDHGIYHGLGRGDSQDYYLKGYGYGGKGWEGSGKYPHYEKDESRDEYLVGDHEKYYVYNDKDPNTKFSEGDNHGRLYIHKHNSKGDDHDYEASQRKGQTVGGFREGYKSDAYKKGSDFYNGETFGDANHAHKGRNEGYGSGAKRYDGRGSHESEQHNVYFRKGDLGEKQSRDELDNQHSAEDSGESGHKHPNAFGIKGQLDTGKSYRYEIKH